VASMAMPTRAPAPTRIGRGAGEPGTVGVGEALGLAVGLAGLVGTVIAAIDARRTARHTGRLLGDREMRDRQDRLGGVRRAAF